MKLTVNNIQEQYSKIASKLPEGLTKEWNGIKEIIKFYDDEDMTEVKTTVDLWLEKANAVIDKSGSDDTNPKKEEPKKQKKEPKKQPKKEEPKKQKKESKKQPKKKFKVGDWVKNTELNIVGKIVGKAEWMNEDWVYHIDYNDGVISRTSESCLKKTTKPKVQKVSKTEQRYNDANKLNTLTPEIRIIKRYAALNGKYCDEKTKETARQILAALQKHILSKEIRKTSEYADEIMEVQDGLINIVNNKATQAEIVLKNIERYREIINGNAEYKEISLLKKFVGFVGKSPEKKEAEALADKIQNVKASSYKTELNKAVTSLRRYADGKTEVVEADQQTLEGLYGLCGIQASSERLHEASAAQLANTFFKTLHLKGKWERLIGKPTTPCKIMIYGKPGHGKSTLALQHAGYLAQSHCQKVLYIAAEEGLSYTMKEKLSRLGIKSSNLTIVDHVPSNKEIEKYDTIFIDSVNNAGLTAEDLRKLPGNKSYVYVMQTTKDGAFRGSQEYLHDVDTCVKVEEMHAHTEKNRFGAMGDAMVID